HVGPTVSSERCHAYHVNYVISGRQKVVMDDGTEMEFGPGDVAWITPGHDGWVVGDEPCVLVDFAGMTGDPTPT
ncbi:MAG TPA: cupin domain-containing protein, partial [Acidimicrobiia bacterium]|nr:cupin domain-containing protein [Acidimicrobiia bacterium]